MLNNPKIRSVRAKFMAGDAVLVTIVDRGIVYNYVLNYATDFKDTESADKIDLPVLNPEEDTLSVDTHQEDE